MTEKQTIATHLVVKDIEGLKRRRAKNALRAKTENGLIDKEVAEIQRLILHGKATTGDHIGDFLIAAYGIIDDNEISKPFRDLEKQMAGKKGQLLLVVQREKKRHVFRGPHGGSSDMDYHLAERYFLGVLSDEQFVLDGKEKSYGLPTKASMELMRDEQTKRKGPFLFSGILGLAHLGETIQAGRDSGLVLEIFFGDEAVNAYSPNKILGKHGQRPQEWIVSLNAAARLLGKNIPETPEEKAIREGELYTPG